MKSIRHIIIVALIALPMLGFAKNPRTVKYYHNGNVKYELVRYNSQMVCISTYYSNGQLKEKGYYKNGKRHGWFEDFYADGTRKTTAYFINDKKDGFWTFYALTGSAERTVFYNRNKVVSHSGFDDLATESESFYY